MLKTEEILQTIVPSFIKLIIAVIIIGVLQILFIKWLSKFKKKKVKSTYVQELKKTITKLTNENNRLKREIKK